MIDRRRLMQQVLGAMLVVAWLFLALSLLGYHPADPPSSAVWTIRAVPPRNPCGPVGACLANLAFQVAGWASMLSLPALASVGFLIYRHKEFPDKLLHALGLGLVVVVAASLLAVGDGWLARPVFGRSPVVGSGGYLGAVVATFLGAQFGPIGTGLILSALGLLGGLLCGESLLVGPARELARLVLGRRHWEPSATAMAVGPFALPMAEEARVLRPALGRPAVMAEQRPVAPLVSRPRSSSAITSPPVPGRPEDGTYAPPPPELLEPPASFPIQEHESLIQQRALILEKALREHGCIVRVVQIDTGPVITMFEIELEAGLRVSKIVGLSTDLAIALAVPSVRIVSPIPGKTTVGIEVPNECRAIVRLSEVISDTRAASEQMQIPLFLGKDVKGGSLINDLAKMPHLLIAGRTGTGKSVCLNAMIISILMTRRPDEVKLILIDPKRVELSQFRRIPHLMHPVVIDMDKAESLLAWACEKMEERYSLLERARVRSIHEYNALGADELYHRLNLDSDEARESVPTFLYSIVIVADELADLVMQHKEVETHIIRLAQKARAAGIHLILATQRPTVEIITGLIKSNMPARIAFQVSDRNNSRVVLDEMGAEKLLGNGDMLFLVPNTSNLVRAQGTYLSDHEINRICTYLEQYPVVFDRELVKLHAGGDGVGKERAGLKPRDELYDTAVEIIIREGKGSTSLLQRALGIGYGRAARLIDYMAEDGIVGESKGSVARDVFFTWEEWEALKNSGSDGDSQQGHAA